MFIVIGFRLTAMIFVDIPWSIHLKTATPLKVAEVRDIH